MKDFPFQIAQMEGPEYQLGAGRLHRGSGMAAVIQTSDFCDEFGMDPISFGSTIAATMELNEKGYISAAALGGLNLKSGNTAAILEAIWRTAWP